MESNLGDLHWFKSSFSAAGNCVEVAHLPGGGVAVRDSKDRAKAAHVYNRTEWEAFLAGAKNGEFDPAARDLPARGERKRWVPRDAGPTVLLLPGCPAEPRLTRPLGTPAAG
jgi:hypothetical protein